MRMYFILYSSTLAWGVPASGRFKSQQCRAAAYRGPPKKGNEKSHKQQATGTGGSGRGLFLVCFSLFETIEIYFGFTKMEIFTGKKAFHARKMPLNCPTVSCWQGPFPEIRNWCHLFHQMLVKSLLRVIEVVPSSIHHLGTKESKHAIP